MNLRPRRRPVPAIPIVSLIDIMVILLIFTTATTTFRKNKTQMQVTLPQSKSMGTAAGSSETRMTLAITKDQKLFLDGSPLDIKDLGARLLQLKADQPGLKLELEADAATGLGLLVEVWDGLKQGGISIGDVPARIQRKP